jgi:hypothetical protein
MLAGVSVQVGANRLQETLGAVTASGYTTGLMNITTHNISTNCLFAFGPPNGLVRFPNVTLNSADNCDQNTGTATLAANQAQTSATGLPINTNALQLNTQFDAAFTASNTAAAESANNLKLVQQARVSRLTRAAAAAQTKFGAGDTRTVAAQAAVTAAAASVARVSVSNQQMATIAPQPPTGGWVLHGRVFSSDLEPQAAQTVYLVNQQNNYQKQYGVAFTDSTGYFAITAPAPAKGAAKTPALRIQVANANGEPVFNSTDTFEPVINGASYRNITLAPGGKPIADPPAAVRKDTLPDPPKTG